MRAQRACAGIGLLLAATCAVGACSFQSDPIFPPNSAAPTHGIDRGIDHEPNAGSGGGGSQAGASGASGSSDPGAIGNGSGGSVANSGAGGAPQMGPLDGADASVRDASIDVPNDAAVLPCVQGEIAADQVVILGDSYNSIGNVAPTLEKLAGAEYREYFQAGASIDPAIGQGGIPYQFSTLARLDDPDIALVIMNGGIGDIFVDHSRCMSTSAPDADCAAAVDATLARTKTFLEEMATEGVKHVVYYYYPHLDPKGGGVMPSPSYLNDWIDYALEHGLPALCCGANAPAAGATDYTCHGNGVAGMSDCTFIDVRPEFVGHNDAGDAANNWFQTGINNLHPNDDGAAAIANKTWANMTKYCIAQ